MIRYAYVVVYYLLIVVSILFVSVVLFAFHPKSLQLVSDTLKQNTVVDFSRMEGSLATGITLYELRYGDGVWADRAEVRYNIRKLLTGNFEITSLALENARVDLSAFKDDKRSKESTFHLPVAFRINALHVKHLSLIDTFTTTLSLKAEYVKIASDGIRIKSISEGTFDRNSSLPLHVTLQGDDLRYDDALHVKRLDAKVNIDNNAIGIGGRIVANTLSGNAHIRYNSSYTAPLETTFTPLPQELELQIVAADLHQAVLKTTLDSAYLRDANVSLENIMLDLKYRYRDDFVRLNATHDLKAEGIEARILHNIKAGFNADMTDTFEATLRSDAVVLPFESLKGALAFQDKTLDINVTSQAHSAQLHSDDLTRFNLDVAIEALDLKRYAEIPPILSQSPLSATLRGSYALSSETFHGSVHARTDHTRYDGNVSFENAHFSTKGDIYTDGASRFWSALPVKQIEHLQIVSDIGKENKMLYINSDALHVTLFQKKKRLHGWGALATSAFDITGRIEDNATTVTLNSAIPSLYALSERFVDLNLSENQMFDMEMALQGTMVFAKSFHINANISLPWYLVKLDDENFYYGKDATLGFSYANGTYVLEHFDLDVQGRRLFSTKPSSIRFDTQRVVLESMQLNDAIALKGYYDINSSHARLDAQSDHFRYSGDEGDFEAALHVRLDHDENLTAIEGDVQIKKALIRYEPPRDKVVKDDDIIVIQELKTPSDSKLFVNLHIGSNKALRYKTKQFDLTFVPDITLWKEPRRDLALLGWVYSDEGWVYNGSSEFEMQRSEIYFSGSEPIDPILNLHLLYSIDSKLIDIYATHTLRSPVFLFTSSPAMSQSDIMSYILFGAPASSSMESDEGGSTTLNAANVLLGTGLKEMIGDTTGLRVDTLSLISKGDGGVGFEVGTRINRDLRVVLKNDDIFALVLQLSLSRTLRIDVDVQETGQGVNLIYIKDYEDWLQ